MGNSRWGRCQIGGCSPQKRWLAANDGGDVKMRHMGFSPPSGDGSLARLTTHMVAGSAQTTHFKPAPISHISFIVRRSQVRVERSRNTVGGGCAATGLRAGPRRVLKTWPYTSSAAPMWSCWNAAN